MKNKNFIIYFIVTLVFIFTIIIVNYIYQTKLNYIKVSQKILFQEASSLFNNVVTTRLWASKHGGIYVKAHEGIKPNPYLEDNHTYTKNNELLIKVNPAWMTRQLSELSNEVNKNYYFKITSLNPKNPNNKADLFEKKALEFLDKNRNEDFYTKLNDKAYDLLGVLRVDESCLSCHKTQNYKVGDTMGGLRVSIPTNVYSQNVELITSKTNILYVITFFTSIVFIFIISYTINSIYTRERNILRLNKTLERKVKNRTKELVEANKKLLKISTSDFLTNIPNRRYFFDMGSKSFNLAKRENQKLCVVCIDIDFFKKVNDTYGHQIGDEVLKYVSGSLENSIRKSDILARTGGEEFMIILNSTDSQGALNLSEKIREFFNKNNFITENLNIPVTISIGISQIKSNDESLDTIIARADKALYASKENGRNQVSVNL
ncbi:diguanylate cyclase [Arcobacter roscoffensis]|uniref:diguanylate cyclase n=1 Tax=Arcobacter roscoffensis TaxID=2961520 RepID=A0ABY5E6R6_9BACT|nr:diguanylate cyclase [Arcobacter roscoffensis]UTJ07431.1 diguanylate cyclase [Arcobacter roscoffensis]